MSLLAGSEWRACSYVLLPFFFFLFVLPVASPGGHDLVAYPPCLTVGVSFFCPSLSCPCLAIRAFFGVFVFPSYVLVFPRPFFSFLSFSFFCLSFSSLSKYLGCWRTYVVPVVSSTMACYVIALSTLLPSHNVLILRRRVIHSVLTALASKTDTY